MKLRYSLLTMAVAMGLTFGLSSCTEEDNPIVPGISAPTNVMVNTLDANQISAIWTRGSDDTGVDTLIVRNANSGARAGTAVAFAGTSTATVNGLSANTLYTVSVASADNESAGIEWATAARSGKIKLWETAGTGAGQPSGLIIGPSTHGTVAAALSVSHPDAALIDIVLATDPSVPNSLISFQSAHTIGSQLPDNDSTNFADTVYYVSGGLNNDYYSSGFGSRITTKGFYDQFSLAPLNSSAICLVRTQSGYYARIEIVPQADGKLWNVNGSDQRSIDVIVSYQSLPNKPYASRPAGKRIGGSVPKRAQDGAIGVVKNVVK
jgi:hypothetical protein